MIGKKYIWFLSFLFFLVTLYFVEAGPWSNRAVAKFNDGYGTFDMKNYTSEIVRETLSKMSQEGFRISYRYYFCDTFFILAFGWLQVNISALIYGKVTNSRVYYVVCLMTLVMVMLRGMSDMIENGLLVLTLKSYPDVKDGMVHIASLATQCKMLCLKIWILLCGIGMIWNVIHAKLK